MLFIHRLLLWYCVIVVIGDFFTGCFLSQHPHVLADLGDCWAFLGVFVRHLFDEVDEGAFFLKILGGGEGEGVALEVAVVLVGGFGRLEGEFAGF